GPFFDDALAVFSGPDEVVVDQTLIQVCWQVRVGGGDGRNGQDRKVGLVQVVGCFAGREVSQFLGGFQVLGAFHDASGFNFPAQAFFREYQFQGSAFFFQASTTVVKGHANRVFARGSHVARLGAGVGVGADVLVQTVHKGPTLVFTEQLQPSAHVQKAGARGGRVRHDDLASVFRLGQIFPGRRHGQLVLFQ